MKVKIRHIDQESAADFCEIASQSELQELQSQINNADGVYIEEFSQSYPFYCFQFFVPKHGAAYVEIIVTDEK